MDRYAANNLLIRFAPQQGRFAREAHVVEPRYNYTPTDDAPIIVPSLHVYEPEARNAVGGRGASRDDEPDVPALVAAVEALRARLGAELPVQYNGRPHAAIPVEWLARWDRPRAD